MRNSEICLRRFLKSVCIISAFFISAFSAFAQNDEFKNNIIEQRMEAIAGSLDEGQELDYTSLFEDLSYYFEHPLNLNSATIEQLRELYILTDIQISNLQKHIAKYGPLRSVYELQAVDDFDIPTIRNLSYFVTVRPTLTLKDFSLKEFAQDATHDLFFRYKRNIEPVAGFQPDPETGKPAYVGSPDYMYTRYRLQYKKSFRAGFTMEKDAGESNKTGPDFYSFHAMYTGQTWLRKLVLGDYQVLFGQGLTLWNGLAFGKSAFVTNVKRNAVGLRPYSSVQETNFLRGGAMTIGRGNVELTSFYSKKHVDGNIQLLVDTTLTDDGFAVVTLPVGGTHRTASEIAAKNQLLETTYGGNLKYTKRTFSVGATAVKTEFAFPLVLNASLDRLYRLNNASNYNTGIDYQGVLGNANFFGEFSRSANGGLACTNGMVAAIHPNLTITAVHRMFGKNYQNLKANVFGENNLTANNERGLYVGMQANLNPKFTLTAYSDLVKYPWLRARVDAPSDFSDYLAQLNYKPDRKNEFYFRYRRRNNEQNSANPDLIITYPVATLQQNFRVHGVYQAHPNVQMKTRAEWTRYEKEGVKSKGFMVYHDVIFKKLGSKASFIFRYALFDSNGWDSRIYAYESDVLYAFSILPYYGKGSRVYGMIKWDITRGVDCWIRYGTFIYTDRNVISSGDSQINGNSKSDIHVQFRLQF